MPPLDHALAWLDTHINLEATAGKVEGLSLERMRRLVELLGDPQGDYRVVHVTGTNGKGSTSHLITRLLTASGLRVGTYASPHLEHVSERIRVDGEAIDHDVLADTLDHLRVVEAHLSDTPSWFELLTAAALRYFADAAVDVAVVEVGKLGRYDATNVVHADVAVCTNIARDHTDGAPGWRRAIAWEKSGIVEPDSIVVLGDTNPEVVEVFADTEHAELLLRGRDWGCDRNELAVGGRLVDIRTPLGAIDEVFVSMHGAWQGDNAAAALVAAEALLGALPGEDLVTEAFGGANLHGRFEVVGHEPLVVIDAAHNPDGAAAAAETLATDFSATGRTTLVVGMTTERDPVAMLESLGASSAELVIATTAPSPRGLAATEIAKAAADGVDVEVIASVPEAVDRALALSGPGDVVFIAGSMYVAGAARMSLRGVVDALSAD
ncbi:MAG: Mur ligase family protein [Acidimicrobiales bacterium]